MKNLIMVFLLSQVPAIFVHSQGCVAIRNVGGISPDQLFENMTGNEKFIFNITNRYFEATKSFRGHNSFSDTLVTNKIFTMNISVMRILNNGWSLALSVPIA